MKHLYLGLKLSFSYFSLIPVWLLPKDDLSHPKVLQAMLFFLPLVGAFVSTIVVLSFKLGSGWLFALFMGVFYMVLYGFLHTEALIDVVDALFARHSHKDPYKVIKEPTVGAMGVLFGVAFVILKVATLTFCFLEGYGEYLVVVAVASRVGALGLFEVLEFRSSFLEELKRHFSKRLLVSALLFYSLFLVIFFGGSSILFVVLGVVLALLFGVLLKRALGFANGDLVGCVIELVELSLLVVVAAI